MTECNYCKKRFTPPKEDSDSWLGPQTKYCSMKCKSQKLSKVFSKVFCDDRGIPEETREWYKEFSSGKYTSLRHFCRENNIVPMTASLRFRKHIPEYRKSDNNET